MMSNTTSALQHLIDEAQRLPNTTPRDVMRFAIAGYLIGSMKHLPGQHDQSTHGHGGTNRVASGATEAGDDSNQVERMGIVSETASELGVSPDIIEYGGDGYAFSVGDDNFIAAGQYDPSTGKITLYKGALVNEETARATAAHEAQHAKYNTVMDEYHTEVRSILNDPRDVITPSGKVRDEFRGEFQTYSAIQPYIEGRANELIKRDGITPYSTSYWKAYNDGKVHFQTAVNETLAEVANQKALGIRVGIPTIWRQMYNDVDLQYHRIKRLNK